jgi:hypothetical protein
MLLGLLLLMFWLGSMGLISKLLGRYKLELLFWVFGWTGLEYTAM